MELAPSEKIALATLILVSLIGFSTPILRRLRVVRNAPGRLEWAPLGKRTLRFVREVLLQETVIRERPIPGLMHALVFWGFLAFGFVTLEHFALGFGWTLIGHDRVASFLWSFAALFAVLVLVGMLALAFRRFVLRPPTLGKFSIGSAIVTLLIVTLMVTHLLVPTLNPDSNAFRFNWWLHAGAILAFLFVIPQSKHLHLVLSPFTTFLKPFELAAIRPLNFEKEEFGAEKLSQLSKLTALSAFTCVECGRCQDHCPATGTGKLLNPKQLMLDLKTGLLGNLDAKIAGGAVPESIFWQCTTCGACTNQCPVGIDQVVPILETRRGLVASGIFPPEMRPLFDNLEKSGNPWGYPRDEAEKFLDAEKFPTLSKGGVLFWLGCMGRYDEKYRGTTRSVAKILNAAKVDWGILRGETCTGDAARRAGNEFLFQTLAQQNVTMINEAAPRTILTSCPHCLRTLQEYRDLGLHPEIDLIHHSEFMAKLAPSSSATDKEAVYHDPCYLSRYANTTEEPRAVLRAAGVAVKEPERTGSRSFCCGAGGAMLFKEEKEGKRINRERTEELLRTGATSIAVACPFCSIMIRDALADSGQQSIVQVRDIAEFAADSLSGSAS